jgi:phosphodiesterase/alkaline phosphatase D-like protein
MKKALCAFVATIIFITGFAQVNVTVGPYLQSPTPSSIKIKWRTDLPSGSKVVYGSAIGNLNQTVEDTSSVLRHTLQLSSLSADTKYYYAIYNGNTLLEGDDADHWFRTFPAQGTTKPVRVWAIGDFGKGNEWQKKVRDAYESYDTTETNLWLWLGDNVYQDGTEAEYLSKVFDSVYGYQKMMKHWAFEPSPGNHDYKPCATIATCRALL